MTTEAATTQPFRRGDPNVDGSADLGDAVSILATSSRDRHSQRASAADVNDDEVVDLADPLYLLGYLHTGGATPPPPPFIWCGADPASGGCLTYDACP